MAIRETGSEIFRPYARLISILGDQLISDKWVGVIELVKNCYDADAENVSVRFGNFNDDGEAFIEIEDDGHGMDLDVIKDVWMKPATPHKLNRKKKKELLFTDKGRVMQGDKGVGRFAIYKLGDFVEVFTKTEDSDEIKLTLDFHDYANDEFKESAHKDKFLDEIKNYYEVHDYPEKINEKGTLIRIRKLRNDWKKRDLNKLAKAFFRMMPPSLPQISIVKDFKVNLYWNGDDFTGDFLSFEKMADLAPFYFEGNISSGKLEASYTHNQTKKEINFDLFEDEQSILEYDIRKLKLFKERFLNYSGKELVSVRKPDIGDFMFFFYGYDLKNPAEGLKKTEKDFLKETSVYLYRDNVRVYPYGEIGDDWLMLSKYRAEDKAGSYFSYNDLIGFVFITQEENPKLRDAADREGLMNINGAKEDFVALIQAALKVMKDRVEIDKNKQDLKKQKAIQSFNDKFQNSFTQLQKEILKLDNPDLLNTSKKFFNATNKLVEKVKEDLKISQELAGTGMAVEKATHDTMSLLKRLRQNTQEFLRKSREKIERNELQSFLKDLNDNLEFLYQELQVLQPLFRVARKVTRDVSVNDVTQRVQKYFRKEIKDGINVNIEILNEDIIVRTNTGLILQVILNLMDNSIYWLEQKSNSKKNILIRIDGEERTLIFADSGPGIDEDIQELIFSEFYSRKSEGRGLGLYIVKELLERINAAIYLLTDENEKILKGANFKIKF